MKTGRLITLKMLKDAKACASQIEEFKKRFGDEVKVTKKLCLSVANVFDWEFAAERFLSGAAWEEYKRKSAPAWEEYQRQNAPLWEEYQRQATPLLAEYQRQATPLLAEYKSRDAALFWKLYNTDIT